MEYQLGLLNSNLKIPKDIIKCSKFLFAILLKFINTKLND